VKNGKNENNEEKWVKNEKREKLLANHKE